MSKSTWISLLVCANLILLTGIGIMTTSPPAALAQGTGLGGNYMAVTGEIGDQYDALYLIDMRDRILYVFYYDKTEQVLKFSDFRELERDFRNR